MNPSASGAPRPSPPAPDLSARRRLAVAQVGVAWAHAPAHVKLMAGPYVGPILEALKAVGTELDARGQA